MGGYDDLELRAQETAQKFFQYYFEKNDLMSVTDMLHEDVVWTDMASKKSYKHKGEVSKYLEDRISLFKETYRIQNSWIEVSMLNTNHCSLSCELRLRRIKGLVQTDKTIVLSMVCTEEAGQILLTYIQVCWMKSNMGLDTLPAAIMVCAYDDTLTLHYVNQEFSIMTGYLGQETAPSYDSNFISRIVLEDAARVLEDIHSQLERKTYFETEYRLIRRNGDVIWVRHKGILMEYDDGNKELRCTLSDITGLKELQEELRLSEKRYAVAMEASGITMFEYDIKTREIFLSMEMSIFYGLPMVLADGVETFIQKGVVVESSAEKFRSLYQRIIEGESSAKACIEVRDAKGKKHDYELSLYCVYDETGVPIRALGIRKNITQILHLQKEQEFGRNFASEQVLLFEADIFDDRIEFMHEDWLHMYCNTENISYCDAVKNMVSTYIVPEYEALFLEKIDADYIQTVYEQGENLISFEYKRKSFEGDAEGSWYKAIINIVKDIRTDHLIIRFYHKNINQMKQQEERSMEERQLYETIISKAELVYEVNFSKNLLITGHESWSKMFGLEVVDDYSIMIRRFAGKIVYPEDMPVFLSVLDLEHVLECFDAGERKILCQYRKPDKKSKYRWYNCILHLFKDAQSDDVKGFAYVEDIDKQKRLELMLKYNAEHDGITGLYNKSTTEAKIREYLTTVGGRLGHHAFMIIDIDYFKDVNDSYGHLFGDEVIKEVGEKIRSLFREYDIAGRIGGDEFCVFMKHTNTANIVQLKAKELCDTICRTYTYQGKQCKLTASVGVSLYKGDGISYEELYQKADKQLYAAKHDGRNRYMIEDGSVQR